MVPAHPPLPTPANLPFHFSSGSQTSKRMCDSAVGSMVPVTRQNGGRLVVALVEPGGVNDPPVIAWAAVMVVPGSGWFVRPAHADARSVCAEVTVKTSGRVAARSAATRAGVFMGPPEVEQTTRIRGRSESSCHFAPAVVFQVGRASCYRSTASEAFGARLPL